MRKNPTHLSRAARKLQAASELTYQQARNLLERAAVWPDLDDPDALAKFASTRPASRTPDALSVYVTTSDGDLDDPIVDGDVTVLHLDWTRVGPAGDGNTLAARIGLRDGLPAGLIDAVLADMRSAGWAATTSFTPGPDRPWAYVTFIDQTFASEGAVSSPDVAVVYHDWSLWFADLSIGCEPHDVAQLRSDVRRLGPNGGGVAAQLIDLYEEQVARTVPTGW